MDSNLNPSFSAQQEMTLLCQTLCDFVDACSHFLGSQNILYKYEYNILYKYAVDIALIDLSPQLHHQLLKNRNDGVFYLQSCGAWCLAHSGESANVSRYV